MGFVHSAHTFAVGETVTAATLNSELRDLSTGVQAAWDTYTPALTATTTNPTLGTSSSAAGTYIQVGKSVTGTAEIVFGTSGVVAGSGNYAISLPIAQIGAASSAGRVIGGGVYFDSSAASASAWYNLTLIAVSSTTVRAVIQGSGILGAAIPVVPAANDQIRIFFDYQAA